MGENVNLLSERPIGSKIDDEGTRLELHENVHWHYRNSRFVFEGKNFYNIATMFENAKREFVKLGMPESSIDDPKMLGETSLIGNGYHSNRLGCELQANGAIHIHYRDLRLRMKKADFLIFVETLCNASLELNDACQKEVSLEDIDITNNSQSVVQVPDIAINKYLKLLEEYDEGRYERVSADDVTLYYLKLKQYNRGSASGNIQRPNGLPSGVYPFLIPEEIDTKYLFAIYESIKKYGYAKGPYDKKYITAYKLDDDKGKMYITGAHRIACLFHMYRHSIVGKHIKVALVEPES